MPVRARTEWIDPDALESNRLLNTPAANCSHRAAPSMLRQNQDNSFSNVVRSARPGEIGCANPACRSGLPAGCKDRNFHRDGFGKFAVRQRGRLEHVVVNNDDARVSTRLSSREGIVSARFNGQFSILSRSAVQFWRASLSTPRGSLSSLIFAGRWRRALADSSQNSR